MNAQRMCGVLVALGSLVWSLACSSVSDEEERAYGAENAAAADSAMPMIRDTVVTRFVAELGRTLASTTSRAQLDWRFSVVNTAQVNAFALPGGFIYVTRGLLEQVDRFDELAGVMAHEIGHVVRRHSVKQLQEREKRDVALVLVCTLTRACRTLGGVIAVDVADDALTAQYSQHDEEAADSEAVAITFHAGIDPRGVPAFFQKLIAQRTAEPSLVDAFFSTHPTDERRVRLADKHISELGRLSQGLVRDTPEFHTVQALLKSLPPPPPPRRGAA